MNGQLFRKCAGAKCNGGRVRIDISSWRVCRICNGTGIQPVAAFQGHSETSRAAAASIGSATEGQRERILDHLYEHGPSSDQEISSATGIDSNSARPRRVELVREGLVVKAGETKTASGRRAALWDAI